MKAVVILLSIVAFIACLILGIQAGSRSIKPPDSKSTSTPNVWTSPGHQRTVVIIVADDLQIPAPRLVSVWVEVYRPDLPLVTFLPLFPPNMVTITTAPPDLAGTFALSPDHTPSEGFLTALHAYKFEWNGYILTDQWGLARTVDWLSGVYLSNNPADGAAALASLVNPWEDPLGALQTQQKLLLSICEKVATLKPEANWLELAGTLMPQHLHTDLSLELAITDWKSLAAGPDPIRCDIPSP
ncbi:MAG: hypothetical protein PHQ40_14300 [Anaerolineaceae bacterium]|nr:hypothetical protein [Anaerolineaceae bacterium]